MRAIRFAVSISLFIAVVSPSAPSWAADDSLKTARELFTAAEKDEDAERWADALDKLKRIAAIKMTPGVHYHIALCEEKLGQLATAYADYLAAEREAKAQHAPDVLRLVGDKIRALGPRVPHLTLNVRSEPTDIEVRVDGQLVARPLWGTPVPIDPGQHRIEAKATGWQPFSTAIATTESETIALEISLREQPKEAAVPVATAPTGAAGAPSALTEPAASTSAANGRSGSTSGGSSSRTGAILTTTGAVLFIGGGVAAYFRAGYVHDENQKSCRVRLTCDDLKSEVRAWDSIAIGAWGVGVGVGVLATYLWLAPNGQSQGQGASVGVGPGSIHLQGKF